MHKDIVLSDGLHPDYVQEIENFLAEWNSYNPVFRIQTSGSTGLPKTIEFNRKQMEASAQITGQFFDFRSGDTLLLNLSPRFVAGKLMIVRALVHGMKLVVAPLAENPLEEFTMPDTSIKLAAFVPYQVKSVLAYEASREKFNQLQNVLVGGAHVQLHLEKEIGLQKTKSYASFGMTETLTHFALRALDGLTDLYTCLPTVSVSQDERGCLIVEPNAVVGERLYTNDLIELLDSKTFRWLGRADHVINSGGVKIFPETDERLLEQVISDRRFYLSARSDEKLGEEVVLIVEGEPWDQEEEAQILSRVKQLLPRYHAPRSVIYLNQFEETPNGKIRRKRV